MVFAHHDHCHLFLFKVLKLKTSDFRFHVQRLGLFRIFRFVRQCVIFVRADLIDLNLSPSVGKNS